MNRAPVVLENSHTMRVSGTVENKNPTDTSSTSAEEEDMGKIPHCHEDGSEETDSVSSLQKIKKPGLIKRNESYQSFLTRSERIRREGKDPTPSQAEAARRQLRFPPDDKIQTTLDVELVTGEDKGRCWVTGDDFDRMETEMKLTKFRWENHLTGQIPFDENDNTIRGLESMLGLTRKNMPSPWAHARTVLEEIHKQKLNGPCDWEKVRVTSARSSALSVEHAIEVGNADRIAREKAWSPGKSGGSSSLLQGKLSSSAKKKGNRFLFWKN